MTKHIQQGPKLHTVSMRKYVVFFFWMSHDHSEGQNITAANLAIRRAIIYSITRQPTRMGLSLSLNNVLYG